MFVRQTQMPRPIIIELQSKQLDGCECEPASVKIAKTSQRSFRLFFATGTGHFVKGYGYWILAREGKIFLRVNVEIYRLIENIINNS